MLSVIHPEIEFKNVANGEVNASASGIAEFRNLAEQSKGLFSSRHQTMTKFDAIDSQVIVEVDYIGVLAEDLPNGMKKGDTIKLTGRSEFCFRDGKICRITDIS